MAETWVLEADRSTMTLDWLINLSESVIKTKNE